MRVPSTNPYYMVGRTYTLECFVSGYPLPNIMWNWQPCSGMGCGPDPDLWQIVTKSRNIPVIIKDGAKSNLTIQAKESGFYQCVATNKEGATTNFKQFIVTGIPAYIYHLLRDNPSISVLLTQR